MKKSAKVTLTVVAAMGLASCGRPRTDPCEPAYFNEHGLPGRHRAAAATTGAGRGFRWSITIRIPTTTITIADLCRRRRAGIRCAPAGSLRASVRRRLRRRHQA